MTGSTRSSTIGADSEGEHPREKSVDGGPGKKQSHLGVDSEDLKAQGREGGRVVRADGKVELTEDDAYDKLGYTLPEWRKCPFSS